MPANRGMIPGMQMPSGPMSQGLRGQMVSAQPQMNPIMPPPMFTPSGMPGVPPMNMPPPGMPFNPAMAPPPGMPQSNYLKEINMPHN